MDKQTWSMTYRLEGRGSNGTLVQYTTAVVTVDKMDADTHGKP